MVLFFEWPIISVKSYRFSTNKYSDIIATSLCHVYSLYNILCIYIKEHWQVLHCSKTDMFV